MHVANTTRGMRRAGMVWYARGMTGLALLTIIWVAGIAAYFWFTTDRQRENHLLIAWIACLIPALYFIALLLSVSSVR